MSDDALNKIATAYSGIESPDSFEDRAALERYREGLLERTQHQADFVKPLLPDAAEVLEVACGNGRLLIELALRGQLGNGFGTDIAQSRIDFANAWVSDLNLEQVRFETEDLLAMELAPDVYDMVACITSALAYFDAAKPGLATAILQRLAGTLKPGGTLLLELYPHPKERALLEVADNDINVWLELPEDDPWRYYLSHMVFDPYTSVLLHEKTFLHRTTGEIDSGRAEQIVLYDGESLTALLEASGFTDISLFEGWTDQPYGGGTPLVATARPAR